MLALGSMPGSLASCHPVPRDSRARRVSGATRDGRCSPEPKGSALLWEREGVTRKVPGALRPPTPPPAWTGGSGTARHPLHPRYRGDKTELQVALGDVLCGARCSFPVSLAPSRGKAIVTFHIPKAIVPRSPSPKPCRAGWTELGGQAEPCLIPASHHHPTALVPLVTSKGRLKPEQDPAQLLAAGAVKMNPQHLGTSPPPSPPGGEKGS